MNVKIIDNNLFKQHQVGGRDKWEKNLINLQKKNITTKVSFESAAARASRLVAISNCRVWSAGFRPQVRPGSRYVNSDKLCKQWLQIKEQSLHVHKVEGPAGYRSVFSILPHTQALIPDSNIILKEEGHRKELFIYLDSLYLL